MIKKLLLINSANFNFLDVNLQKDLFFLGDNGSGKTTVIRAIHYLYSGDVRNLGIPSDKDGFKEYYFKFENSYMIYVFEDFFIFMYKSGGEITKLFSHQEFDITKVIKESGELYDLDEIKRYTRIANLKKTVKSLSEYRDIIYGNNKKFLDFSFTPIRNSDTFISLFNEIFNIDKSIIDAKSIKKAIQTTLDYKQEDIDFNHEDYLQKIYEFKSEYSFFKEFEKQKKNIDDAYDLKERLLSLEDTFLTLQEQMAYRIELEREELHKSVSLSIEIDKEIKTRKEFLKIKRLILKRCETNFRTLLNESELEISRIKTLKLKFSHENILSHRESADRYEEINSSLRALNESYIKLNLGFENQLKNIEKEIEELKHTQEKKLVREFEGKLYNQTEGLKSILQENIQKEQLDFETKHNLALLSVEDIKSEIAQYEEDIRQNKVARNSLELEHKTMLDTLKNSYEEKKNRDKKEINEKLDLLDKKQRAIKNLDYDLQDLQRVHKKEHDENENSYRVEQQRITQEIQKYRSMISAKANSFKEFLHEEVDAWERELYPILDESLLDMSIDALKPKLLDEKRILSIDLDTSNLKKILSVDEAEAKIEILQREQNALESSYKESVEKSDLHYQKNQEEILNKQEFIKKLIESLTQEIDILRESIKNLDKELLVGIKELNKVNLSKESTFNQTIKNLNLEIQYNTQEIDKIQKSIRVDRSKLQESIQYLKEDYGVEVQALKLKLQEWLAGEQKKIDELIEIKSHEKNTITKDERLKELEDNIAKQNGALRASLSARNFLEEYEKSKNEIETLAQKENLLKNQKIKNEEFHKRVELKIENYELKLDKLQEKKKVNFSRDKKLKKGLMDFETLNEEFDFAKQKPSEQYLYSLVEEYSAILREYTNKKLDLKSKLDRINSLKNSQNEIDVHFNLTEYDDTLYISKSPNTIVKIDDIIEYKNKKLAIVKRSGHKKFTNFVKNLLPHKMSVFNDSEDKFSSQVAKINKNLSEIDFGVIKNIKIDTKIGDKKSISKMLQELNNNVANLSSLLNESSLFYEKDEVLLELNRLESQFKEIKKELKGNAISLQDTIDLSLSFIENGKEISQVSQLKNESSTGGSMLLKIAIAISILKLFIKEDKTPFFLIVDEVSRLHSINQEKLRVFANSKGFGIVFVTPEPTYSKPELIKYYRFRKNSDDEFEAIELNL